MSQRTLLPAIEAQTLDLTAAVQPSDAGIVSRMVLQTPELRVVLFAFAAGQELTGQSSRRRAVVQIITGECEFQFNGAWARLTAGALLHLPPEHLHAVRAHKGPFSMLLTFGADTPDANALEHHPLSFVLMNTQAGTASPSALADRSLTHFDVRPIPCSHRHFLIFQRWAVLEPGAHFVLVNDHDPAPLYYQFAGKFPDAFEWEYLVAGPDEFQVKITRLKATPEPMSRTGSPTRSPHEIQAAAASAGEAMTREVDARGLEPPEPMLKILSAIETLPSSGVLRARTDRRPIHLLPELETRGMKHESEEQPDGSWITTLRRA